MIFNNTVSGNWQHPLARKQENRDSEIFQRYSGEGVLKA